MYRDSNVRYFLEQWFPTELPLVVTFQLNFGLLLSKVYVSVWCHFMTPNTDINLRDKKIVRNTAVNNSVLNKNFLNYKIYNIIHLKSS